MTKRMRWDLAAKRSLMRPVPAQADAVELVQIQPDEKFWQRWHKDSFTMRHLGYRVQKVDNRWQVWATRKVGERT